MYILQTAGEVATGGDNSLIIVISTVCSIVSGAVVQVANVIWARKDKKTDDASQFREELRAEVSQLRLEVQELKKELDETKEKYFKLHAENVELYKAAAIKEVELARLRQHTDHCPLFEQE